MAREPKQKKKNQIWKQEGDTTAMQTVQAEVKNGASAAAVSKYKKKSAIPESVGIPSGGNNSVKMPASANC